MPACEFRLRRSTPGRTDHEGDGWPLADPVKLSVEKVLVNLRLFPEQ